MSALFFGSVLVLAAQARPGDGCCAAGGGALALAPEEVKALSFQVEEERMARELYTAFAAKWDVRQFTNIRQAEARHEESLRQIAARAGLALPAMPAAKFADSTIQQRFDVLLAQGLRSPADALKAGIAVEQQDLADLRQLLQSVKNPALRETAERLATASERHLAAFSGDRCDAVRPNARGQANGAGAQAGRRAST